MLPRESGWEGSRNSAPRDKDEGEFRVKRGAGMAAGSSCGQQGLGPERGLSDRLLLVNLGEETGGSFRGVLTQSGE